MLIDHQSSADFPDFTIDASTILRYAFCHTSHVVISHVIRFLVEYVGTCFRKTIWIGGMLGCGSYERETA